jgi:dihydrofolate reductase
MVFPVVLGAGKRLFESQDEAKALELVEAKQAGETYILTYAPKAV